MSSVHRRGLAFGVIDALGRRSPKPASRFHKLDKLGSVCLLADVSLTEAETPGLTSRIWDYFCKTLTSKDIAKSLTVVKPFDDLPLLHLHRPTDKSLWLDVIAIHLGPLGTDELNLYGMSGEFWDPIRREPKQLLEKQADQEFMIHLEEAAGLTQAALGAVRPYRRRARK